ncbi:MAG: putative HTH transcriptional regulator [Flavobacteriales bacterium]|jgi:predicted HTH transcriptional regulator
MSWIEKLITEGEHQQQDFKMRVEDAKKIAKTLVAFANTDGGRLLIGVKDNGSICGVRVDEELHVMEGAAQMECDPPITIQHQIWWVNYIQVLEIVVEPSRNRPHFAQDNEGGWTAYIRQDDKNIKANGVTLKVWEHEEDKWTNNFEYDEHKERLFNTFKEKPELGFARISKLTGLDRFQTEDMLAQLIVWKVVEMRLNEKGCAFRPVEQ